MPFAIRTSTGMRTAGGCSSEPGIRTAGRPCSGTAPQIKSAGSTKGRWQRVRTRNRWRARHAVWECPQLIEVDGRHVLLVSLAVDGTTRNVAAAVVDHARGRLHIDDWSPVTHGPGHYAASVFVDADGKPCVMFWIRGIGDRNAAWRGALSIPYRLSVVADRLVLAPHPVLDAKGTDAGPRTRLHMAPRSTQSSHLSIVSHDGRSVLDLLADSRTLMIETPSTTMTAPMTGEVVNLLFDGCVVEIASNGVVVGLPTVPTRVSIPASQTVTPWWR